MDFGAGPVYYWPALFALDPPALAKGVPDESQWSGRVGGSQIAKTTPVELQWDVELSEQAGDPPVEARDTGQDPIFRHGHETLRYEPSPMRNGDSQ